MFKNPKLLLACGLIGAIYLSGCASWKPMAYAPSPAGVSDAGEDFQRLVMTAKRFRPTRIEMHQTFASLIYAGAGIPGGIHTVTVPFNEIENITVLTTGDEFAVRAADGAGSPIYEYVATNQKNAQEFADVLAALTDNI